MEKKGVYVCTKKTCRENLKEVEMVLPQSFRMATGRPICCHRCGNSLLLRRIVNPPAVAVPPVGGNDGQVS